ncbi:hypothetical protein PVK06_005390 [Gossypium arboreum]|uniref:Uncharacterized protein n=1 Tax=Gossypium arboreum TaxID=29729 RepID=A0ABR0QUH1_GOSAR|nr:hypothetical protein PVK06_005390 [Gossypium arboreum]
METKEEEPKPEKEWLELGEEAMGNKATCYINGSLEEKQREICDPSMKRLRNQVIKGTKMKSEAMQCKIT